MSAAPQTHFLRQALCLARRGYGHTAPNPMVGAVLVRAGRVLGRGWHRAAGQPHAEIEALRDAARRGADVRGATLYVTLEPCSTHGRTPPCTAALVRAGLARVVAGATDPNPQHQGRGFDQLRRAGLEVVTGVIEAEATQLNEPFNHWIVHRTPFVTLKAAMTLDGKIATAAGASKWITGQPARARAMQLRQGADAILVGINTVLADDPCLTVRCLPGQKRLAPTRTPRRIVLDSRARTPPTAQLLHDAHADATTIVVTRAAPTGRVAGLRQSVSVWVAPTGPQGISLPWLLQRLGAEEVTHLLVEGGGEVLAAFWRSGLAQRLVFFYAPKILGGRLAHRALAGPGATAFGEMTGLTAVRWARWGDDLCLTARLAAPG
ncbi:MAG: bifunctional diaminohydroxyphosphoribosylaminopyrimidine deaminase/5-amino-6-(5-phosphoribosylamino)uracil reductase RibD [Verrucomicrobia bacterium]|nr:bifunctional diaminohydroxyphosphoribosylaminopyrimidine deaminase/5-amino-6-(5-phosphoribosylamino)uracil reductase RibD [Verrucomicrobiota bacterium]